MSRHGRVLVAMSGGVDSSVAAVLLHEAGYEVVGVTMKTWDYESSLGGSGVPREGRPAAPGRKAVSGCCSLDDMNDARAVAVRLGATHLVVDIRDEFGAFVSDRFAADYLAGRTPNPCVLCNTHVKWGALLRRADALGCEHIATGHYAQVRACASPDGPRHVVSRGVDRAKDQSYVLWGVAQAHLARTLLPLGGTTKPEIRRLAATSGLEVVAAKPDSYEICFVPDDDYRGWLRRRVPGLAERVAGGPFVHALTGETVGRHEGTPFFTVGQRRGLGLALGGPVYVTAIDPATNTVTVGPREALRAQTLHVGEAVWGAADGLPEERRVLAQTRAHGATAPALARQTAPDAFEVVFDAPERAVAPGQAAVLYDGDDVLAGGWIARTEPEAAPEFVALPTLA